MLCFEDFWVFEDVKSGRATNIDTTINTYLLKWIKNVFNTVNQKV